MVDQNINKDNMIDPDLIDVESLNFTDDQTWLYTMSNDSGQNVDIIDFNLSCDWPIKEDEDYLKTEKELYAFLDNIMRNDVALPDKQKFDSRTFVRPKKRMQRPSIHNIVESSMSPNPSINQSANQSSNKYLTYNKYSNPLGPISPMLRLKTFNVDTNTDNSNVVKQYAMKRRSLAPDDDPQLEDILSDNERGSEHTPFKPIKIDYSQPAHNIQNTFNKGFSNIMNERGSLTMYQSGESLMRMSPPSLASSLNMENSFTINTESLDGKKSLQSQQDLVMNPGRDSIDPMMTSLTLSILDEKDMGTSFLSQTTYPDNDSLMDSLPPSLVNSVNSSYIVSNTSKPRNDNTESNIFSSATFTHLEHSEKLLSARPRIQMFNSYKRDSIKCSESYTKAREEACQIDTSKVLNENCDNFDAQAKESPKRQNGEMSETITLHYSNNKFRRNIDAEKENVNSTFEKDNTFYDEMNIERPVEGSKKDSLNVTLDKQELNEIIQARQKLSLARKALPNDTAVLSTQADTIKKIQLPNQIITVPKQSMENASELLSRRKAMHRPDETPREPPKRNATFRKMSPKSSDIDTTLVFVKSDDNIIDINSATMNLIDTENVQNQEWGAEERAMIGSNESTDTGTFSSSSPPELANDTQVTGLEVASTPLMSIQKISRNDLLNLHNTISPIYDIVDDKSYTVTKVPSSNGHDMNTTTINTATISKKSAKRDILAAKSSPEKKSPEHIRTPPKVVPTFSGCTVTMAPPAAGPRKTSLPTSKLRQYSSHRELNRIPAANIPTTASRVLQSGRTMVRRPVYASNPALSPTAPNTTQILVQPQRRDTIVLTQRDENGDIKVDKLSKPAMTAPPALVRQGTETLRRERPQSQLVQPKDLRLSSAGPFGVPVSMRNHYTSPPTTRPYSIAGSSQLRVARPASGLVQRQATVPQVEPRSASVTEPRVSALPRPSRLPAPRRTLRAPSVYSVAPAADVDHY